MAVAIFDDITERKQAEEGLRRFELLSNHSRDIILFMGREDGRLLDVNAAAVQAYGYRREELLGLSIYDLCAPDTLELAAELMAQADAGGILFETVHRRKDGSTFPVEVSSQGAAIGGVRTLVSVVRNITERKRTEEELSRTLEELKYSNAELEQFAYVASHDLQEPLRMVSSYLQLLAKRYQGKLGSDADDFIGFAVDGAKRMQTLINDLLALSRVGTRGKPLTLTSCEEAIEEAIANLQIAIQESAAVITHATLPPVQGDPTQLVQLFQNLLGNALKFRGPEPPCIHVSVRHAAHEWVFAVCDNGIGIDPKFADRIFVIFQRLHDRSSYPGTGIGLAICKRIIQRHGGRIWVESQTGEGATFYFTLPSKETI
jgi:PAS domain S-box-containing protein